MEGFSWSICRMTEHYPGQGLAIRVARPENDSLYWLHDLLDRPHQNADMKGAARTLFLMFLIGVQDLDFQVP